MAAGMGWSSMRAALAGMVLLTLAAPGIASAQWTRVADVPSTRLLSLWSDRDTIAAGADTAVYLSTDAGTTWSRSSKPVSGITAVTAICVRNGRLYAGTFGQGVFVSDDRGATWHAFNEGLVGGILDTQLDVVDFQILGNDLYAATAGAGVYRRSLAPGGTWQPFGGVFEPNQASNVNSLALGGTRLIASAGDNGMVFVRDPGDAEWTVSNLDNVGVHAGLEAMSAVWTGFGWVVGTNSGIFHSAAGGEPWTRTVLGPLSWTTFATVGRHVYAGFDTPILAVIAESDDEGATWQDAETFDGVFIMALAVGGNALYAARGDGLWRRTIESVVAVGPPSRRLRFAVAGAQPFADQVRLRFDLPEAGAVSIALFDVLGRAAGNRIEGSWSAGPHEVSLDARDLPAGIYAARLTAGDAHEALRLVHVR